MSIIQTPNVIDIEEYVRVLNRIFKQNPYAVDFSLP